MQVVKSFSEFLSVGPSIPLLITKYLFSHLHVNYLLLPFEFLNPGGIEACGTFLVVQWLRIHLPTQGTRVRILDLGRSHMPQSN